MLPKTKTLPPYTTIALVDVPQRKVLIGLVHHPRIVDRD